MTELKMEHVLILVIVAFMLYHLMGSSKCVNRFRIGGQIEDDYPDPPCDTNKGITCRMDPSNQYGPVIDSDHKYSYGKGHQPYCNQDDAEEGRGGSFELTQKLDIANCQLSDPRCFWDYDYNVSGTPPSWTNNSSWSTPYGACRSFCNATVLTYDKDKNASDCYSIVGDDAEERCAKTAIKGLPADDGYDSEGVYNCIWGGNYNYSRKICKNPIPPSSAGNAPNVGSLPCETDINSKKTVYNRKCPIEKWAPKRFYMSDSGEKYCECPSGYSLQPDMSDQNLLRCQKFCPINEWKPHSSYINPHLMIKYCDCPPGTSLQQQRGPPIKDLWRCE